MRHKLKISWMEQILALILAAGRGTRAGEGLPKTYRKIGGHAILRHSVATFLNHPKISKVQIVIHPDDQELYTDAIAGFELPEPVLGGETRAISVANGLNANQNMDKVLIHDGARPYISNEVIDRVITSLETHDGAIPALPVTDALWDTKGEKLLRPVPRESLVAAQTPQGFNFEKYTSIIGNEDVRDDAQAAIEAGLDVVFVEGCQENRKLTYPEDFT